MRLITEKHCSLLTYNTNIFKKNKQFTCGVSTDGFSLVFNCFFFNSAFSIVLPIEIHLLKGFAKNLWSKTKKLKNNNKLEFQLYFKDILNTGVSLVKCADDFKKNCNRSYISVSLLGFTIYIAKIYPDFI